METIQLIIDNKEVEVPRGTTILDAAKSVGIHIPTLCYMKLEDLHYENNPGACRICVVEIEGRRNLAPSCKMECTEGMVVRTHTPRVMNARRTVMELILSNHPAECLTCSSNGHCELQKIAHDLGIREIRYKGEMSTFTIDRSPSIVRNMNKCIMCRRCETMCNTIQTVGALTAVNRGFNAAVSTAFERDMAGSTCSYCGQCVSVCPVNALSGRNTQQPVLDALADPTKIVIAQTAPAVRTALGRDFGYEPGTLVTGKMVSALRQLGFDYVFDTDFAADLTIMEEAHEFLDRVQNGGVLPLITSCSPGWIKYCEHYFPDMTENLSSCKSPQQMFGAIAKSYYAEKMNLDPKDIVSVSIMPCTAKKFEIQRPDEAANGIPDVDYSLTTRELARMIRKVGLKFTTLPDEEFDAPLGLGTGAAVIFGATGGVMEAALRTAVETLTGEELQNLDFTDVRGMEGIKEATYPVAGLEVKVAIASGLGNARKLLEKVKSGEATYHFIEIMGCPGGCINGGGQPQQPGYVRNSVDIRGLRAKVLYDSDKNNPIRKSHENPAIKELYATFLGEPGSEKAHHLLHTTYVKRKVNEI